MILMIKEMFQSALHPKEIRAMFRIKFGGYTNNASKEPLEQLAGSVSNREFCYAALNKVSRSFAVVIQQLPEELRGPCMSFLFGIERTGYDRRRYVLSERAANSFVA